MARSKILLTGPTGYVGGQLLRAFEEQGQRVRYLARRPESIKLRKDSHSEVITGDVLRKDNLTGAFDGIDTAYYLIHSMGSTADFEQADRDAARNFGEAARQAGIRRIIYLGGLGSRDVQLSSHLRSRQEVGELLRASGVQVIEFRASIIIGAGSFSFEIIRALVERLPVMIAPRWVATMAHPIAIKDVVYYLAMAAKLPHGDSRIFEIGGTDTVSYGEIMREYARQRHLHRAIIPVPVLTPRLSSLWLSLVSPVHARMGRLLIEGLRNPTLVRDHTALTNFRVIPMGIQEAIANALADEDSDFQQISWMEALSSPPKVASWGGQRFGSRIVDSRTITVKQPPAVAFQPIQRIGGKTGWYYANWLWKIRGLIDSFVGGVGLRRGREHEYSIKVGDTLDFWRVEIFEPGRRLRLFAEMKLPGRAWLDFEVTGDHQDSTIRQTAIFDPLGLPGLLYWYSLYPLHRLIFDGMLYTIKQQCPEQAV